MYRENSIVSPLQEECIFQTLPHVHKTIFRKLGSLHRDSVEDLKQKVFLKLWRWKSARREKDLSSEEWQKLANVVARNEIVRFFSEKYARDVPFSQANEAVKETIFSLESPEYLLEGNSEAEIRSLVVLIWKAAQILTLRQRYAFVLQSPNLVLEFVVHRLCSVKELADYFETTEERLSKIMDLIPLSDEEIGKLLEEKFSEAITPNKIWEARSKGKARVAAFMKDYISDERLPVRRRT